MAGFLAALTALGAILGGFILILGVAAARGAPQEAASAAMAMAITFIPYALFRLAQLGDSLREQKRTNELLKQLAERPAAVPAANTSPLSSPASEQAAAAAASMPVFRDPASSIPKPGETTPEPQRLTDQVVKMWRGEEFK